MWCGVAWCCVVCDVLCVVCGVCCVVWNAVVLFGVVWCDVIDMWYVLCSEVSVSVSVSVGVSVSVSVSESK